MGLRGGIKTLKTLKLYQLHPRLVNLCESRQSGQSPAHKPSLKLLTRLVAPHFTHGALSISEHEVRCNRGQFNTINCSNQPQATVGRQSLHEFNNINLYLPVKQQQLKHISEEYIINSLIQKYEFVFIL